MPVENPSTNFLMKTLIEKYFTIENSGCEIPDLESVLLMKNGFAKDIRYQANFLMNYETNTFGMDVMLALISKGEPYVLGKKEQMSQMAPVNETFLQSKISLEEEQTKFLMEYYDFKMEQKFTNFHKVCKIRELNPEPYEEIIVKKNEEE